MKPIYVCLFALLLVLCLTGKAQDIRSNTEGFSVNLNPSYASWSSESVFLGSLDDLEPTGLGIYAKVAYGFTQNIEVYVGYGIESFNREVDWDTYRSGTFDLGGRFNFGATLRPLRPFAEVALSIHDMTIDPIAFDGSTEVFNLNVQGSSFTAGLGLHYFLLSNLSLTLVGKGSFGSFGTAFLSGEEVLGLDESLDFEMYRIHLGATYFFE
ncbi:MAG: hypothetical protein AAGA10_19165 [Bacteroidota bacterium]